MAELNEILGNERIKEHFITAVHHKKISHAYIMEGDKGSGKKMLAEAFSKILQCEGRETTGLVESCGKCESCIQMEHHDHPDVIWVSHEKPNVISVGEIREQIVNTVEIMPYKGPYKIYIVDEAEKMNAAAQNAILKTIEEPPEYAAANMRRLQEQRQALFFRLQDDSASACAQLSACLTLAEQWAGVSQEPAAVPCMEEAVLSFLRSCEVLTSDWKQMLEQAANAPEPENLLAYTPALDQEIRLFTMDMLYRYYLRAAYAETPEAEILPVQMAAFSVCVVLLYSRRLGFHTAEQRLRIWQLFVKEIEYDGNNLEELEWQLETNAAFSPAAFRAYFASLGGVQ
jgi:hypothetical protein